MAILHTGNRASSYRLVLAPKGLVLAVHAAIADEFDIGCMQSPFLKDIQQEDPRIGDWQLYDPKGWGCRGVGAFDGPRPDIDRESWIPLSLPYPNCEEEGGFSRALDIVATLVVAFNWLNAHLVDFDALEMNPPTDLQSMLITGTCRWHGYNLAVDASPAFREWLRHAANQTLSDEIEAVVTETSQLLWPHETPAHRMFFSVTDGVLQLRAENYALNPEHLGMEGEGFTADSCECDTPDRALVIYRVLAELADRYVMSLAGA